VAVKSKTNEMMIRDYFSDDFDSIWQLDQVCFEPGIAYDKRILRYFLRQPGTFTLIAENTQGELLGFMLVQFILEENKKSEAVAYIITIDIHPNARRSGTATILFLEAENRAKAQHCVRIDLEVAINNDAAIAFYKRQGFKTTGRIEKYYNDTLDAFHMEKRLV
jgi:ribosomal-protein-alanine N-acetyltransferase